MRILLMISVLPFMSMAGCHSQEPTYICSKAGTEYIQTSSGLAVHENVLGINVRCEKEDGKDKSM